MAINIDFDTGCLKKTEFSGNRLWQIQLKWSLHIPPDVPCLDPTLIHADPPFRSLQASLWPQEAHLWPFGQFLAIKWAKMAGSKVCLFGSRPSSTQRTTYIHWFSRKDNFEIPPPP